MADTQYVPLGQEAAPAGWVLPANLELLPKMVYASLDGSGSSGPFVPCLRIISDSGHVAVEAVPLTTVAVGGSADVSWFHTVTRPTVATGPVLQAFVSSVFPNPSGPDYAAAIVANHKFDYWMSFDLAFDAGVLGNLAADGCTHLVAEGSPTTFGNHWVGFGLNEQGPGFNVPQFYLEGRNGYAWFGGPAPAADRWYHIDLHVVYDSGLLTFSPELFIDGIDQHVPTNYSVAPGPIPGDEVFYFGTDQFCGPGVPSSEELTWLKQITVGTSEGGSEIADLTTAAELHTAITNGSGDNPAASLSVLTTNPF